MWGVVLAVHPRPAVLSLRLRLPLVLPRPLLRTPLRMRALATGTSLGPALPVATAPRPLAAVMGPAVREVEPVLGRLGAATSEPRSLHFKFKSSTWS